MSHNLSAIILGNDSGKSLEFVSSRVLDVSGNAATTYSGSEVWLPVELLILIASYIRWRGDFLSLCKVSKRFRTVYTPFLYRIVNLYPDATCANVAIHLSLYCTLQHSRLSEFVTEFRVTLVDDYICMACITSTSVWPTSLRKCSCQDYNRVLGKALILMKNLRTLAIHCRLCLLKHSHSYLHHLETRTLTEFQFQCLRSVVSLKSTLPTSSIFLAPCMRSITALALECHHDNLSGNTGGYDQINKKMEVLPNLRILSHDGGSFCADLLVTRPIERLCVPGRRLVPLHGSISRSPGRLSHLFMINLVEFLRPVLATDLAPYRHLRFVGTITLGRHNEHTAVQTVEVLKPLRNLEAIEINHMTLENLERSRGSTVYMSSFFGPTPRLFALLDHQHPILRRVLVVTRYDGYDLPDYFPSTIMWEKTDRWRPWVVPYLEYWDILQGKMDDISSGGCDSQFFNGTPGSIHGTPRSFYGSPHSVY